MIKTHISLERNWTIAMSFVCKSISNMFAIKANLALQRFFLLSIPKAPLCMEGSFP
jgi:hypothetical protein